jgi:pre-mRNA-splicing factor ATP-dependent RNA helicase DHX15/PRP43
MMDDFSVVIIDEAHEHSPDADLLLGHLKSLLDVRENLKVVIMSASIDTALFTNYLPQAVLEEVSGRRHKVTVDYLDQPPSDLIAEIINTIFYVHLTQMPGDILVFVSGKWQIKQVIDGVEQAFSDGRFDKESMGPLKFYRLHGSLSMKQQLHATTNLQPHPQDGRLGRKVIVTTNSAETSLTIEGVTHVIDSCKEKAQMWNPHTESWRLLEQPVSKASVLHCKGRAGRTCEGMAWLMCTERGYQEALIEHSVPQFLQGDMLSECLTILVLGHDPITFDYIVSPAPETIVKALEILYQLGAITEDGELLPRGKELAAIPTNVYAALTLLESVKFGCSDEIISIVAMVEATTKGGSLFRNAESEDGHDKIRASKRFFQHPSGEHLTLFNIYMAWRTASLRGGKTERSFLQDNMLDNTMLRSADHFRLHYLKCMGKIEFWENRELSKSHPNYYTRILQALAAGHFLHTAKRDPSSNEYQLVRSGMNVSLTRHTDLGNPNKYNEWVIYNDCSSEDGRTKDLRVISSITPELLVAAQPEYWWDAEFLPEGHIKNGLLQTLTNMIGPSGITPTSMPGRIWPQVQGPNWIGLARFMYRSMMADKQLRDTTLPSWQRERNRRAAKVEQLKEWDLEEAISAGFDDGSSRYVSVVKYCPSSLSLAWIDGKKIAKQEAEKRVAKSGRGGFHGRRR